ncbi:D12 class N6 adenine-specific DNA methyltransferase [Brachyspira pilosicoli WesB]|uniref:site-specific DNA-methyltransferase (adenine-specific) n=1 Tax=Brachyspira pilosicoli WesB TaxID=1161918 RepID=K0JGA6_BRAPL|nr:type ISP restriction/modification enzyme [Brachyspira pilosicoli]CCG57138.1 D12 class N6 adenine-specific DNA methyltransferase [Brachyspira pilosicoli WesB]
MFLENYLESIKNITAEDKEHTYRGALEILLNDIKNNLNFKKVNIKHEPNNDKEGRGAPDFLVTIDSLVLGYIENKRVNANLDEIIKSEQIKKYLLLSGNIIITDYLRFVLIDENLNIIDEVRICELSEIKNYKKIKLDDAGRKLLDIFKIFFSREPKPINTALEFADALAMRTRILRDDLYELKNNNHIERLYNIFKTTIYSQIDFADFCDNFAQTLTYSLFLARLNTNEKIDLYNVTKFIPKSFPLIRAMSKFLQDLEELNINDLKTIKWLLNEIINITNHINIVSIVEELNKYDNTAVQKDPYMHFYETFLYKYNPELRELRGVYYTPQSVVNFIIDSIDIVLKEYFNKDKGLGDALEKDTNIRLLDFATGTGTFLLDSFRKALSYYQKNSVKYNPKELINKFYGFEFMIAPYTIAHLKISQTLKEEFNYNLQDDERLNIFLTNTLENIHLDEGKEKNNIFEELNEEMNLAQKTKEKDILVITGNPPYSGASANKGIFEEEVRKEYKDGLEEKPLAITRNGKIEKEKNPKWLLDDYVKFIRFAQQKIDNQKAGGIFGFISNNSFLDNPTFRGMRYSLLKSFDEIYIVNLHGNTRKKEVSPDGSKDENVFDIMQGVSINIFVRYTQNIDELNNVNSITHKYNRESAAVYYYDLYGKREYKYKFLFDNNIKSIEWNKLEYKEPFFLFVKQDENLREEYDNFYSLKDMFRIYNVGIVTSKDSVLIGLSEDKLKEQVQDYYNEFDNSFVEIINYRPFDKRFVYYDTNKVERARKDIMEHFLKYNNNIGLVFKRGFPFLNSGQGFITNKIIDLRSWSCPGMQGGDCVAPLYLYNTPNAIKNIQSQDYGDTALFKKTASNPFQNADKIENFTVNFRKFIDEKYSSHFSPEDILGYIYAVLFHKTYRTKYIDFLKIDFPKIPFTDSKDIFIKLSSIGTQLYNLHLMKDNNLNNDIGEGLYKDDKNNKIEKPLYNEKENKLFINKSLYFDKVSKEVWLYKIGGYQVLDKYLKSHKDEEIDYSYFQKIIQVLDKSIILEKEISDINFF